jgi:hypothetical protein
MAKAPQRAQGPAFILCHAHPDVLEVVAWKARGFRSQTETLMVIVLLIDYTLGFLSHHLAGGELALECR